MAHSQEESQYDYDGHPSALHQQLIIIVDNTFPIYNVVYSLARRYIEDRIIIESNTYFSDIWNQDVFLIEKLLERHIKIDSMLSAYILRHTIKKLLEEKYYFYDYVTKKLEDIPHNS